MPTSTDFNDIRKWHNHYGTGGALYSSWSLGQTELRYMAEKKTGAVSLNDFAGKIGYLAKDPSYIGTSTAFLKPGRTKIDLMSGPNQPSYASEPDTFGFGDPMGDMLLLRCQGGTTSSAVFGAVNFFYNGGRPLTISFDFIHRANLPAPTFSVVIVEQKGKFQDSTNRVLHSELLSSGDDRNIKNFSQSISFGSDYPYKQMSLQNNIGAGGAANYFTGTYIANMRITE